MTVLHDTTLQVRYEKIENGELETVTKKMEDIQHERKRREEDTLALREDLEKLLQSRKPSNNLAEVIGQTGATIVKHNCEIERLKNTYKLEIEFKKTTVTTTAVLHPQQTTKLSFFDHPVVFERKSSTKRHDVSGPCVHGKETVVSHSKDCEKTWLTADAHLWGIGVSKDPLYKEVSEVKRLYFLATEENIDTYASAMKKLTDGQRREGFQQLKVFVENTLSYEVFEVHTAAFFHLGECYYKGRGLDREDHKKAARWFKMAADHGYALAQYHLGLFYYSGKGVTYDPQEAAHYYRLAAEQNFAQAQWQLGVCYHHGCGVERDVDEELRWTAKAAKQGHSDAQTHLLWAMRYIVQKLIDQR